MISTTDRCSRSPAAGLYSTTGDLTGKRIGPVMVGITVHRRPLQLENKDAFLKRSSGCCGTETQW